MADRILGQKAQIADVNEQISALDRVEQQRLQDAGITKASILSRRTLGRPRTPPEDAVNPFEKLKMEEELAKYKRYLQLELPEVVTKQVNDIFEKEESGLKAIMKDRDQLLRAQLGSFHDYLKIMDQSRVREISDLNNLKLEVDELKRGNERRVQEVHKAFVETDKLLSDEADWKRVAADYNPATFTSLRETSKPYQPSLEAAWSEDRYLRGSSERLDLRRDADPELGLRKVQSQFLGLPASPEGLASPSSEPADLRKSRINELLHELDHIMDEMNSPSFFRASKPAVIS